MLTTSTVETGLERFAPTLSETQMANEHPAGLVEIDDLELETVAGGLPPSQPTHTRLCCHCVC